MSVHPNLDIEKAAQVAALFLKASGGTQMKYIRLLKLMYVLERESLQERGRQVVHDDVVAMPKGPVLSGVYGLIKSEVADSDAWDHLIETRGYNVQLVEDPKFDRLTEWEVLKIHQIVARFADLNRWELIDHLHETLPEWQAHKPGPSGSKSIAIPLAEILKNVNAAADAEDIEADIAARESLRQLLGG